LKHFLEGARNPPTGGQLRNQFLRAEQAGKNSLVGMTLRPPFLFARLLEEKICCSIFIKLLGKANT